MDIERDELSIQNCSRIEIWMVLKGGALWEGLLAPGGSWSAPGWLLAGPGGSWAAPGSSGRYFNRFLSVWGGIWELFGAFLEGLGAPNGATASVQH